MSNTKVKNVILLANEAELWGKEHRRIKEKLIGHTLVLISDTQAALKAFLDGLKDTDARTFLEAHKKTINKVFAQSQFKNLRVLRQSLNDFARVFPDLDDDLREQNKAMKEFLYQFLALSLEFKMASLGLQDFEARGEKSLKELKKEHQRKVEEDTPATPVDQAQKKYDGTFVKEGRNGTGNVPVLLAVSLICDGWVNSVLLNRSLRDSDMFETPDNEPEWQTLWWVRRREEPAIRKAFKATEEKFKARTYTAPEIIMHVFSVRLMLAEAGLFDFEMDQVKTECQTYFGDILDAAEGAKLIEIQRFLDNPIARESVMGLGYPHGTNTRSVAFHALWDDFVTAVADRLPLGYSDICQSLLDLLGKFKGQIITRLTDTDCLARYRRIPVLQAMNVKKFTKMLLTLDNADVLTVFKILKVRYENNYPELEAEAEFRTNLHTELQSRLPELSEIRRWQIGQALMGDFLLATLPDPPTGS